jgi:hypothetical protein
VILEKTNNVLRPQYVSLGEKRKFFRNFITKIKKNLLSAVLIPCLSYQSYETVFPRFN